MYEYTILISVFSLITALFTWNRFGIWTSCDRMDIIQYTRSVLVDLKSDPGRVLIVERRHPKSFHCFLPISTFQLGSNKSFHLPDDLVDILVRVEHSCLHVTLAPLSTRIGPCRSVIIFRHCVRNKIFVQLSFARRRVFTTLHLFLTLAVSYRRLLVLKGLNKKNPCVH